MSRRLLYAVPVLAIIVVCWPIWLPWLGLLLVVRDPLRPADAIVPMAGGENRVQYAAMLVQSGFAPRLVTSDIGPHPPFGRLSSMHNHWIALRSGIQPAQLIATDRVVTSTYSELRAIRDLAQREQWRTLIIVSSPEHTRRTQIIAGAVFRGSGIRTMIRPVEGYGYHPSRWWNDEEERRLVLHEYPKIMLFLLGYRR